MLSMRNLIKVGALKVGDTLVWNRKNQFLYNESHIKSNLYHKVMRQPFQLRVNGHFSLSRQPPTLNP